jgi:hypothetical protein
MVPYGETLRDRMKLNIFAAAIVVVITTLSACDAQSTGTAKTQATPSDKFTAADIAKLKWLEGTWRGMDGDKPFFERYALDGTTLVVETLEDGSLSKVTDTSRFELINGQFCKTEGNRRSAASQITDTFVQFVPASGGGNSFRFQHQPDGTWNAILEWPGGANRAAGSKTYHMEPWPKAAR